MKELLKDLWRGKVSPYEQYVPDNKEIKDLRSIIERNRENLL